MSLLATVQAGVETAFSAAGDLIASVTWQKTTPGAYTASTGSQAVTVASRTVRAVVDEWGSGEREKNGLSDKAVKLFIPEADFALGTAIEPEQDDRFVFGGITYTAKRAKWEGVKVLWEVWGDV
jgi:hypothetical protein